MKGDIHLAETTEERLRKEIEDLKRQLREQKSPGSSHGGLTAKPWHPSSITLWSIFLGVAVLIMLAFFAGYTPLISSRRAASGDRSFPRSASVLTHD
jgi:type VI protein secretion system component VasF